jgi:precorrin-6A synthase
MRKLLVIGIGAGDPEYVTVQAIKALNRARVFFVADKGEDKDALNALRREICERYIEQPGYRLLAIPDPVRDASIADYQARVRAWHEQRVALYEQAIARELPEDGCGAFLVWGDPSLYDSTLRIVEQLAARAQLAFEYEVIPGISAIQALAARHKLVLNRIGGALQITTGRRLAQHGFPREADDVVVMLDGEQAFERVLDEQLTIYWGAYLGDARELTISGDLGSVHDEIVRTRDAARTEHGWIMDTYLLRKRRGDEPL